MKKFTTGMKNIVNNNKTLEKVEEITVSIVYTSIVRTGAEYMQNLSYKNLRHNPTKTRLISLGVNQ